MPNGDIPGGSGFIGATVSVIQSILGFGGGKSSAEQAAQTAFAAAVEVDALKLLPQFIAGKVPVTKDEFFIFQGLTQQIAEGKARLAAQPLVTERFETLPPFEPAADLPVLQELGIPFMDEPVQPEFRPIPPRLGPIPEPDFLEEKMPVDVPLLTSSFLPALRQATTPSIQAIIGGFTGGLLQEVFRPTGELGLGQIPLTQAVARVGACPPEKPSTRILRSIKANTGVSINLSRAKSLIRELGLEHAARCLAITAQEVCQLLIVASPRRRRGISASDIRIVRRTARRFENLKHDLGHLGSRPHRRARHHAHK